MIAWKIQFEIFACGIFVAMAVLGLLMAFFLPFADRRDKRFFIFLFASLVPGMLALLGETVAGTVPSMVQLRQVCSFFSSLFITIPLPMFAIYLLHSCGESIKKSRIFLTVVLLWILYFIILVISQFTTCIYYISPDNELIIGPWYPLGVLPLIAIMILNIVDVFRRRNSLSKMNQRAFLFFLLPLTIGLILQLIISNYLFLDIGLTFSALSMFFIILINQSEQHARQQQEIAKQQANIMVLQMRPHFIYNTMTSIYYLCELDPEKAQQVTMSFTNYLRRNFTAIASEDTVPFSTELEHARAYLAVEQAGFEDRLTVEYDTPHTVFRLPPLTLQPIVENAVKHGMDPDSDPLHITIRTCETEAGSEITVEDNGIGFEHPDDNEPHIALANIQKRLKLMCHGKMITMPREGGGTVVKVIIPR